MNCDSNKTLLCMYIDDHVSRVIDMRY